MENLPEQEQVRRKKLEHIENPYPERFEISHEIKEARNLPDEEKDVSLAGRIVFMRKMGKLTFLSIQNVEAKIQLSIKKDVVGEEEYEKFKKNFDLGDFIGVTGEMFTTHTGEKTLRAESYQFLGKALKPLPEKFHGLTDTELCYRERYVDLIMNEETRKRFLLRSNLIKELRKYLEEKGYIEIETPILINKPSGAAAKPFMSHHNALDIDVYLRIAPETYLKRAVVGGFDRVFEFARCFRNEGMDSTHLQDFTMLEYYWAYANYKDNMKLTEDMLKNVIKKVTGSLNVTIGDKEIDLSKKWKQVSFRDLVLEHAEIDINEDNTKEKLIKKITEKNIELESETNILELGFGNIVDLLYKKVARPKMIEPVFLIEHPIKLSPLARANDDNPDLTDRFQLIINGAEVLNAYSELVDPVEQKRRLEEQSLLNEAGDEEAMVMDEDYITAMEYGMPPISGWGMGIDRLVQLLTNAANIKDGVMFPLMKLNNKQKN